jgi:hypothetical protein
MRLRTSEDELITATHNLPRPSGESFTKKGFATIIFIASHGELDFVHGLASSKKPVSSVRLSQDELYPVKHAYSTEHFTALKLLGVAINHINRAVQALNEEDGVTSDSEIQRVQVLLPELFCFRGLGDGFGTVINGVMSAFESLQGNAPNAVQLRILQRVFELLRSKPFLSSDEADQQLERLETASLNPYPPELVEFLSSGESVR